MVIYFVVMRKAFVREVLLVELLIKLQPQEVTVLSILYLLIYLASTGRRYRKIRELAEDVNHILRGALFSIRFYMGTV